MSRPLRIQYPGAIYHVMNRGLASAAIFQQGLCDRHVFYDVLDKSVKLWRIKIHAFSLMDNHYHLLIETPQANLSRAMRHIDGVYTQRFNFKTKRDGPLFRGRFKSILVDRENYFLELLRYIHLNGVRAGLCSHAIQDLNSSHRIYMGVQRRPIWLTTEEGLSRFSTSVGQARERFDQFVHQGVPQDLIDKLDPKRWPAVIGTQKFIEQIRERFLEHAPVSSEIPQARPLKQSDSVESILREVAQSYRLEIQHITQRCRGRGNPARNMAMWMLRNKLQMTYGKIGAIMDGVSCYTVAVAVKKWDGTISKIEKNSKQQI